jgi:hypothetical protein
MNLVVVAIAEHAQSAIVSPVSQFWILDLG